LLKSGGIARAPLVRETPLINLVETTRISKADGIIPSVGVAIPSLRVKDVCTDMIWINR